MDLKMEVYTPGLELIGFLEIQRSVIWEEKAFSSGSFSVESLITDESLALLRPENIIWIEGETAGIIEYVHEETGQDGPYIAVKGYTLTGILARRILWGLYSLKGTAPQIMHALVDDCAVNPTRGDVVARKIPGLVLLDAPTGGEAVRIQKTGGTLLEALEQLGETYGVAFGVRFNPAVPQMEFWTRWGQNRSVHQNINEPVFYSTELDDVLASEYSYNSQNYRNVSLVAGEGEGKDRVYVTVENEVDEGTDIPTPTPPESPTAEKYTVTLLVDQAGGGVVSGGKTVAAGVSITVTAAPSEGYEFVGWRENGSIVSTDKVYTFTVAEDRELTAVFAAIIPVYVVTVSADPSSGGAVSGGGSFEQGQTVTLTQTTADGYRFAGWYNASGELLSKEAAYTFTPTENVSVAAKYTAIPIYTVTVSIDPAGSGTVTGAGQYREGESVTVKATAVDGYTFAKWTVGGVEVDTGASYTFTVTGDVEVVAVFGIASRLPSGYTELQYIQSSGQSRINTKIVPNVSSKVVIDIEPLETPTSASIASNFFFFRYYKTVTGGSGSTRYTTYYMFNAGLSTNGVLAVATYNMNSAPTATVISSNSKPRRMVVTIDCPNKLASCDSESETIKVGNMNSGTYLYIPNNTTSNLSGKIYSFKCYSKDTIQMDLVPCTNPDGLVGMYDLVGKAFYSSEVSSYPFIAGPAA